MPKSAGTTTCIFMKKPNNISLTPARAEKKYGASLDLLDLDLLLADALKKTREFVFTYPKTRLSGPQIKMFLKNLRRRQKGEPLAYILGHKEFFGLDFLVNKRVLIPRPETELLVEEATKEISNQIKKSNDKILLIDVGTGSGCVPIAILKALKHGDIGAIAIDISAAAIKVAKHNAKKHQVKIKFIQGDLLKALKKYFSTIQKRNNVTIYLTANLPYLTTSETRAVKFEPPTALSGGAAGLAIYKKLFYQICELPTRPKYIYLEIGWRQAAGIKKLIKKYFPQSKVKIKKDLAGFDRLVFIEL